MKKILSIIVFSISALVFAQEQTVKGADIHSRVVKSIQNDGTRLVINDSIILNKGGLIKINLPAGKDFVFVRRKKKGFGANLISKAAGAVGSGAAAVGVSSHSVGVVKGAVDVMNTAQAVQYGSDALENIQNLPISNKAKKIAGQSMTISGWQLTGDGYIMTARLQKKEYEINLQEAVMANEVIL